MTLQLHTSLLKKIAAPKVVQELRNACAQSSLSSPVAKHKDFPVRRKMMSNKALLAVGTCTCMCALAPSSPNFAVQSPIPQITTKARGVVTLRGDTDPVSTFEGPIVAISAAAVIVGLAAGVASTRRFTHCSATNTVKVTRRARGGEANVGAPLLSRIGAVAFDQNDILDERNMNNFIDEQLAEDDALPCVVRTPVVTERPRDASFVALGVAEAKRYAQKLLDSRCSD